MPRDLAEPWRAFLADLDALLTHDVRLHCCGGFVVTTRYGLPRTTADLDVVCIVPGDDQRTLAGAAGRGSALHKAHGVYLDVVTVATYPDSYEDRLEESGHGTSARCGPTSVSPSERTSHSICGSRSFRRRTAAAMVELPQCCQEWRRFERSVADASGRLHV